jgi:hypothetical protein
LVGIAASRIEAGEAEWKGMRGMPFFSPKVWDARAMAAAAAFAAIAAASPATPALAGDDGYKPIWTGVTDLMGLTGKDKEDAINYRERARLVLPPQMTLPPPAPSAIKGAAAWPVDPEVVKKRKEREAEQQILESQSDLKAQRDGAWVQPDQLRADRAMPGERSGQNHCGSQSNTRGCDWIPFRNVFENIGLVKESDVVGGQEPDREWLTDPPKGYRRATKDTMANFDAPKRVYDGDPRTQLYHTPEQ